MSLRAEFQEFVDEVTGKLHPGEPLNVHIHHIVREGVDCVGAVLKGGADPQSLEAEITAALTLLISQTSAGPFVRKGVSIVAPFVAEWLVQRLADFTGPVDDFIAQHVDPRLAEWEATIHRVRIALGS